VNGRELVSEFMRTRMYPELILELELRLMAEVGTSEPPRWIPLEGGIWLVECTR
jgi:hypothetical protein